MCWETGPVYGRGGGVNVFTKITHIYEKIHFNQEMNIANKISKSIQIFSASICTSWRSKSSISIS
jgi:hypothetical protein